MPFPFASPRPPTSSNSNSPHPPTLPTSNRSGFFVVLFTSLNFVLISLSLVLLILCTISVPLTSNLYFLQWTFPEEFSVTGYRFGQWGGCRTALYESQEICSHRIWGYNLNFDDLQIYGAGNVIDGKLTKALGVLIPFAVAFAGISTIMSTHSLVLTILHKSWRQTSAKHFRSTLPLLVVTSITFIFTLACTVISFKTFVHAMNGINGYTDSQLPGHAMLGNCLWIILSTSLLLLISLMSLLHLTLRTRSSQRRHSQEPGWNQMLDPEIEAADADRKSIASNKSKISVLGFGGGGGGGFDGDGIDRIPMKRTSK